MQMSIAQTIYDIISRVIPDNKWQLAEYYHTGATVAEQPQYCVIETSTDISGPLQTMGIASSYINHGPSGGYMIRDPGFGIYEELVYLDRVKWGFGEKVQRYARPGY